MLPKGPHSSCNPRGTAGRLRCDTFIYTPIISLEAEGFTVW